MLRFINRKRIREPVKTTITGPRLQHEKNYLCKITESLTFRERFKNHTGTAKHIENQYSQTYSPVFPLCSFLCRAVQFFSKERTTRSGLQTRTSFP